MKKLNEIPKKNDRVNIKERNKILDIMMPENGIDSRRPQVIGIIDTKI
jgi:hypothetical protein